MLMSSIRSLRRTSPLRSIGARWMSALETASSNTPQLGQIKLKDLDKQLASPSDSDIKPLSDWKPFDMSQLFPDEEDPHARAELNKLRNIEEELMSGLATTETKEIDWSYWEKEIKYPGLVQAMKEQYENTNVPDFQGALKQQQEMIHETFDPVIKEMKEFGERLDKDIEVYEKRLKEVSSMADNLDKLTVDEWLEQNPECKKEIEDDVKNNRWFLMDPEPSTSAPEGAGKAM